MVQLFSKHCHCVSVFNPTVLHCHPVSVFSTTIFHRHCVSVFNLCFCLQLVFRSSTQLSPPSLCLCLQPSCSPNNVIVFPSLTQLSSPSLSPAQLFSKQCHCVSVFNPTVLHVTLFLSSTKLSISQCISIFKDCILLPSTFILKFWQLTNTAMRT